MYLVLLLMLDSCAFLKHFDCSTREGSLLFIENKYALVLLPVPLAVSNVLYLGKAKPTFA